MTAYSDAVRFDLLPYINGEGLDLGCGDARPWDWMVGIDINPGTTQRGPNLLKDARKLNFIADKSQDFVFSSYLMNEITEWRDVLPQWWSKVNDNGYLILFLPITETMNPKDVVDVMQSARPWQLVEAKINGEQFFQVYRKRDEPLVMDQPDPDKICALIKLGAHGDALWASSVLPHLKEQGFYTVFYTQDTGEEVLRHDPHIDRLIKFESRVPLGELGQLFLWMEAKYKHTRILVECVEGTLLPSPQKIQYHFPEHIRHKLMDVNYLEMHHGVAKVPMIPRQRFYPNEEEKRWANTIRSHMAPHVVVLVPNGSSCTKYWPYAPEFARRLLERHEDLTVVVLGDLRDCEFERHRRLAKIGLQWPVRSAMTFCQLADVVVGQETGLLNSVAFEKEVHKIVLLTHSSVENLTRDWPNCDSIRMELDCSPCHRLQYDWTFCNQDETTKAAKCQAMISADMVLEKTEQVLARLQAAA